MRKKLRCVSSLSLGWTLVLLCLHPAKTAMKWKTSLASAVFYLGVQAQALSYGPARDSNMIRILGSQGVNLWKLNYSIPSHTIHEQQTEQDPSFFIQDSPSQGLYFGDKDRSSGDYGFPAQWFQQPLDHFDQKSQHVFHQRYWVNTRHYKPRKGAPVIVLDGGETSGEVCPMLLSL